MIRQDVGRNAWNPGPQQNVKFQKPGRSSVAVHKRMYPGYVYMGNYRLNHRFVEILPAVVVKLLGEPIAKLPD